VLIALLAFCCVFATKSIIFSAIISNSQQQSTKKKSFEKQVQNPSFQQSGKKW
jgi:hypothetical protein